MLTAVAVVVAVAAAAFLLSQVGQLGRQPPAPATPTVAPAGLPQPGAAVPPVPTVPRAGQGAVRVTSRVIEASYTVRSGDTLGSISSRFGVSLEALQSINNLADRDALSVGQKLVIPNQE